MIKRLSKIATSVPNKTRKAPKASNDAYAMSLTESKIQCALVQWAAIKKIPMVKISNEGKRSLAYGARMKREGLTKGFPDLMVLYKKQDFGALFIELKRSAHDKLRPEQKEWLDRLNDNGYKAVVCYGLDQAMKAIEDYVGGN